MKRGYLFSGNLIYQGCLYAFYPTTDPVLFCRSVRRVRQYDIAKILPGHHTLDLPVSLIGEMESGWTRLEEAGQLYRGAMLFEFGSFQIRL